MVLLLWRLIKADTHQTSILSKYQTIQRQTAFGRKELLFGSNIASEGSKASEDSPLHSPKTKTKTSKDNPLTKTVADYFYGTKGADNRQAGLITTKITYRESDTTPYFYSAALNAKDHLKP
ncbi:hypothetical protein E3N88_15163 [Mikania micrantha]|uniref:Uncharacterized protein n=1 Tax=Mikania micrantha TaxID=192012 RepID=A0A5N6NWY0_9ASTR|nr:hypothetical protein E3N88_15163 [Mikania micrantha]